MLPDRVSVFTGHDSDLRAVHKSIQKNAARQTAMRTPPTRKYANKRVKAHLAWKEIVSPRAVFHRDDWVCQLCGKPTLRPGKTGATRLAPTVDHIVPLSLGGAHAMWNVQCAHSGCNEDKANTASAVDLRQLLRVVDSTMDNAPAYQPPPPAPAKKKARPSRKYVQYCFGESDGKCRSSCRTGTDCSAYAHVAQTSNEKWWGVS